ncbi:NAD binding Rossmann fold oxidoreductase [Ilyonectria robusta]|uniref:NAD binding Rossmann fold oxidoreductase n=1 Tax=Ilyonectria robusta TaxID=1079257 RepID=UPI001E8E9A1C|nr:NAD binding Rossmann fold oxidoreductase [Ilyonectria robusta]KAH8652918.1 NAD binding Rossmann fold oxidoreductase [Ilyonectria robusta]
MSSPTKTLKLGIIGCVEITQAVFISTIGCLRDYYRITYLCDSSHDALQHCRGLVAGASPSVTHDARELIASPDVDAVVVMSSYEDHVAHTVMALEHNKFVIVEKPLAMSLEDADAIIAAERKSSARVFVGYIRRYAPAFLDALNEIGSMDKIDYVRVRDIIGPNCIFISQSGTFPKTFAADSDQEAQDRLARRDKILATAIVKECNVPLTAQSKRAWALLGGLGCHDISAMREVLGMPTSVVGVSLNFPFWKHYPDFAVSYESGLTNVPDFDAHIEVYSANKIVRVKYDSAYIKGAPTTIRVVEGVGGALRETLVRQTYEDEYTLELKEFYEAVVHGKPIKTSAQDARLDLEIFGMILQWQR